jgi:hypothetical protein
VEFRLGEDMVESVGSLVVGFGSRVVVDFRSGFVVGCVCKRHTTRVDGT